MSTLETLASVPLTEWLAAAARGDSSARDSALRVVYPHLLRMAQDLIARSGSLNGMTARSLIHESWIRLNQNGDREYTDRQHFFALCARAMAYLLIDIRRRQRAERSAIEAQVAVEVEHHQSNDVVRLDVIDALAEFERIDPDRFELIVLKHLAGMTLEEVVDATSLPKITVRRRLAYAEAWFAHRLSH